jgi:hypothetical protein
MPPVNFTHIPLHFHQIANPFHQSPQNFLDSNFSPQNFNHSYIFNCNSELGDSCAKILRIISSFSSSYSNSYECCICVILCLSVRRICSEVDIWKLQDQVYKGFQDKVYEDFNIKYTRTLTFSFQSNEEVSLNVLHIYFPVYSIIVVLHARVNECALMLGLTRFDLSFLEALA